MYLNLLILCGILSQVIIGSSSEENTKKTSDLLVRKKRIIDQTPGGNQPLYYSQAPYIVNIKHNRRVSCSGSIISPHHVLTSNRCILEAKTAYEIKTIAPVILGTSTHYITQVIERPGYFPNDLVLLVMIPHIDLGGHSWARKIELNVGPILPNKIGTIIGWQHNVLQRGGLVHPVDLRSIEVPIISHQECASIYQGHFPITDKHICTFDPSQQKHCSALDIGAPLVLFSHLVGVLVFVGETIGHNYPDVFINLDYPAVRTWLEEHIEPYSHH